MTQIIAVTASPGNSGAIARLFAESNSDSIVATASAVDEPTNRKSLYLCTFTGVTNGVYLLILFDAEGEPLASRWVKINAASGYWPDTLIDFEELAGEIAPLITSSLAGSTIVVSNANLSATGDSLEVNQGDHYADIPTRIDIDSEADLTAYHLVIAARLQTATTTKLGLRMSIQTDEDGQFALFGPTSEQTEAWSAGTYELRYRIEYAENQYRTIGRGILTVLPFDTPEPLVDVDP